MSPLERDLEVGDRWVFDEDVAREFDEMLARSVPSHEAMREAVAAVVEPWVAAGASVLDLGTSRGEMIARLLPAAGPASRFVGVEVSPPMVAAARSRFADRTDVSISEADLRELRAHEGETYDVVLAVLALMFVPLDARPRLLGEIRKLVRPGGALVVVEKVLGASPALDALLVDRYYRGKRAQGYSEQEIERKRLALEGVLVPLTADWNRSILLSAGFPEVECFWRSLSFAGWVALG